MCYDILTCQLVEWLPEAFVISLYIILLPSPLCACLLDGFVALGSIDPSKPARCTMVLPNLPNRKCPSPWGPGSTSGINTTFCTNVVRRYTRPLEEPQNWSNRKASYSAQSGIFPWKFTVRDTGGAICPGIGIGTVFKTHTKSVTVVTGTGRLFPSVFLVKLVFFKFCLTPQIRHIYGVNSNSEHFLPITHVVTTWNHSSVSRLYACAIHR